MNRLFLNIWNTFLKIENRLKSVMWHWQTTNKKTTFSDLRHKHQPFVIHHLSIQTLAELFFLPPLPVVHSSSFFPSLPLCGEVIASEDNGGDSLNYPNEKMHCGNYWAQRDGEVWLCNVLLCAFARLLKPWRQVGFYRQSEGNNNGRQDVTPCVEPFPVLLYKQGQYSRCCSPLNAGNVKAVWTAHVNYGF